jgi:serine/threonine protein kinase
MSFVICPRCAAQNAEFNLLCASCGGALPESVTSTGTRTQPGRPDARAPGPESLSAGQLIRHYQLQECLGGGGMGLVFRAFDTRLGRTVALKFLGLHSAQDPVARARFLREARTASALDHPNIGTVYAIEEADGALEGQLFIAMALYEGETLQRRIARGPLPLPEVESVLSQIAWGLAAAHARHVVHRDLKPANVFVTRSGEVKLLDFGLAKLLFESESTGSALTQSGQMLGTAAYMSPEQIRGEAVDPRTDLWSLGAVAYEMLTGHKPFRAENSAALFYRILHEEPAPLGQLCPAAPGPLRLLIQGLLRKRPEARLQSAREVLKILGAARQQRVSEPGPPAAPALNKAAEATPPRRSVAVLGFKNLSGRPDAAWLSVALSEMLGTELAAAEQLRVLPGEEVARMKIELALAETDSFGKETLSRIRRHLGTDLIVLGSYLALADKAGRRIRVDFRLQDAALGETLASVAETGTEADLFDLVSRVGARLLARCFRPGRGAPLAFELVSRAGVGESPTFDTAGVRASMPSNPVAARLYSEGLAKLWRFDALGAKQLFEGAVAADPEHPLSHWALAEAWTALGYKGRARQEARRAFDLSGDLPRAERLWVEALYCELSGQPDRTLELYRTLWEFFPDRLDYGLALAGAQTRAGKGTEALATLEALRRLPPPATDDPRLDLEEVKASALLSDYRRQRVAAERAAGKARVQGGRLVLAHAWLWAGDAEEKLGQPDLARAAYQEAGRLFGAAGDRRGEGKALRSLATLLRGLGEVTDSERLYEQALRIFRAIGDQSGLAHTLALIALWAAERWDLAAAKARCAEALAAYRDIDDKQSVARVLRVLADALQQEGDLTGARHMLEEALAAVREIGYRPLEAEILNDLAITLIAAGQSEGAWQQHNASQALFREIGARDRQAWGMIQFGHLGLFPAGDLSGTLRLNEEALAIFRQTGFRAGEAHVLFRSGPVLLARGDLAGARARCEESLAIGTELGERDTVAISRVHLAQVWIEEGRASEAEKPLREAVEELRASGRPDGEVAGAMSLARALLAQGRWAEAESAIGRAAALLERHLDRGNCYSAAVLEARIQAALGWPDRLAWAVESLNATLAKASQAGFVLPQLEARLALAQLELEFGQIAAGRKRLQELEKEAAARGFGLIASKAGSGKAGTREEGHQGS